MMQALLQRRLALQSLALSATGVAGVSALTPMAYAQGFDVTPWPASRPAPPLQATDLQGKLWRLSDLRERVVLINFWATWCEPCRAEMPTLQQLAEFYGEDKLVVLAVNFKESVRKISQYVQGSALGLNVLPDVQGELTKQWGVSVFPTTILIDGKGRPRQRIRGEVDWTGRAAAALVEPLLANLPQRASGAST
jgi:thiol-disulfide isomerase/thioredoxin